MLCSGHFSLQDSMAAMELLDRKMDSCEVPASKINFTPPHSNSETDERVPLLSKTFEGQHSSMMIFFLYRGTT